MKADVEAPVLLFYLLSPLTLGGVFGGATVTMKLFFYCDKNISQNASVLTQNVMDEDDQAEELESLKTFQSFNKMKFLLINVIHLFIYIYSRSIDQLVGRLISWSVGQNQRFYFSQITSITKFKCIIL